MTQKRQQMLKLPGLVDPVLVDSIICVEGDTNYTWLHTTNRPKYLCALTLKRVEAQLPGFIRIHKSSLINPSQVAQVRLDGPYRMAIYLTNGIRMLVARRRIELVRQQLGGLV